MQKAKAFFVVCLGFLAIALAYHFGASTAKAQTADRTLVGVTDALTYGGCAKTMAVDNMGTVYVDCGYVGVYTPVAKIPGTPVAITTIGGELWVSMANGDVYRTFAYEYPSFTFEHMGNVFGAPTPAQHTTWGKMKGQYRR